MHNSIDYHDKIHLYLVSSTFLSSRLEYMERLVSDALLNDEISLKKELEYQHYIETVVKNFCLQIPSTKLTSFGSSLSVGLALAHTMVKITKHSRNKIFIF